MTGLILLASLLAADDQEANDALDRFKTAYQSNSAAGRAAAVSELARVQHEKIMMRLVPFLTGDAKEVRMAAAKGLGGFKDWKKQVGPILMSALGPNDREPEVQAAIFVALGTLDDETALPKMHEAFEDKDSVAAKGALQGAGLIRHVSSIDPIIELMKKYEKITKQGGGGGGGGVAGVPGGGTDPQKQRAKDVLPATIKAMQAITKEKWTTSQEWQIWWSRKRATFKIED